MQQLSSKVQRELRGLALLVFVVMVGAAGCAQGSRDPVERTRSSSTRGISGSAKDGSVEDANLGTSSDARANDSDRTSETGGSGGTTGKGSSTGGATNQSSGMSASGGSASANGTGGRRAMRGSTGGATSAASSGGQSSSAGAADAAAVASLLGRDHFLIGMGNDLNDDHSRDGAYTLGTTLDIHYAYLSGLKGRGGWPDQKADGAFVDVLANSAHDQGVVPMFTLYGMVDSAHEGDPSVLVDDSWMTAYWDGAKLLFQRIGTFDAPAIVHLEPDFWAFMQQKSMNDASKLPAHVKSLASDCASQPDTVVGVGKCLLALGRKYAPKAVIGFHASRWAADPASMVTFLKQIGAGDADIVVADMLDHDAGCFEAKAPECTRNDGPWYWDESNATSPNFHEHIAWSKAIAEGLHKPMLWWQVPFGVPSTTPGGTAGHYRDNRVRYVFEHVDEFVAAGGLGVVFGTKAANQTDITTDGGQFKNAVEKYFAAPTKL